MAWAARTAVTTIPVVALLAAGPCHAERHCGIEVGNAAIVKMWDVQPPKDRKTTRELIISIVVAHQRYRACNENMLTVVVRLAPGAKTVFLIKD